MIMPLHTPNVQVYQENRIKLFDYYPYKEVSLNV